MAAPAALAPRPLVIHHYTPEGHSVMEDVSDDETVDSEGDIESDPELERELEMDADQQRFYQHQQQQAMYYQQHQQQNSNSDLSNPHPDATVKDDSTEDAFSDDDSSTASIPDENIDFSLTYALHTFLATVEGQASVVKGDSLLLLDDANSYWWLVRVLKTEDVGYIPAENIETPYERLARLNKHRNVDLAAATMLEKQAGAVQGREKLKGLIAGKARGVRNDRSGANGSDESGGSRRVVFAPPTYVDHPGVTWSSDEETEGEGEEGEEDDEPEQVEHELHAEGQGSNVPDEAMQVDDSLDDGRIGDMEPDDGVEWADGAGREEQKRQMDRNAQRGNTSPARDPYLPKESLAHSASNSSLASASSSMLDPAAAGNDTRRITVTPSVAQGSGPLLPSAIQASAERSVSGQSTTSMVSATSVSSSLGPSSPDDSKKMRKKKPSKEDMSETGEKRRSKGMLGGLFSRKKDKKGVSSSDPRASEDSIGQQDPSALSQRAPTPAETRSSQGLQQSQQSQQPQPQAPVHSLRLQQRDQAVQQAYTNKYLKSTPGSESSTNASEAAAAVAQSAAAARLAATATGDKKARPSSIILSPNPAGPPLLNVIRVFAGEHIRSEASFKTVLLNETTSSTDLLRQLMQRFRLPHASTPEGYFLTIKDVSGEEMELMPGEKPLVAFQETVQRWASEDDEGKLLSEINKKVKRSSVSSISSVMSLSAHPAIEKLGMSDFSDDSTVKIYFNRRRPGSAQQSQQGSTLGGMTESASDFSSYSTQLSTVHEASSPEQHSDWSNDPSTSGSPYNGSDTTASPPQQIQQRFNPSLSITTGQASPERFSSPSSRFTIQLVIHPKDLPDTSAFDPQSDAIVPLAVARDRQSEASYPMDSRKRLFTLPRNATVVETIEQGLERFGVTEGVVDGGDDVEDKSNRRSGAKVRYALTSIIDNEERHLATSSKILDAYPTPPQLRPVERTTIEQRRRSRDHTQNIGSPADILPSDPIFVLRRIQQKLPGPMQRQQAQQTTVKQSSPNPDARGPLSPQEIIAAQRAASRATQKALISAHVNAAQGVDVVLPDRGTIRSSRLLAPSGDGEVVRYSYIDGDGETYDISEILEEEWGKPSPIIGGPSTYSPKPPNLLRLPSEASAYVTAPSTPEPTTEGKQLGHGDRASRDILQVVLERSKDEVAHDTKLEERIQRVIQKAKSGGVRSTQPTPLDSSSASGRTTPQGQQGGRTTPQPGNFGRPLETLPEGRAADVTPRASSRQAQQDTAMSVNRIIGRHQRQQPSIASIMSDLSASPAPESIRERVRDDRPNGSFASTYLGNSSMDDSYEDTSREPRYGTRSSTPLTATSSTHPTPPVASNPIFSVHSLGSNRKYTNDSPTPRPRQPVAYTDDFGIKSLMALIDLRSRDDEESGPAARRKRRQRGESMVDEVEKRYYGERIDWDGVHPEIKGCFVGVAEKLDRFDNDIDELLASVLVAR